jgi:hypothetical protein
VGPKPAPIVGAALPLGVAMRISHVLMVGVVAAPLILSPSAGAAVHPPAKSPEIRYFLVDRQELDTHNVSVDRQPLRINGTLYLKGYEQEVGQFVGNVSEASFDVQRRCSAVAYTAGIPDDQDATTVSRFQLFADGRQVDTAELTFGHPVTHRVPIPGVLRLRFVLTALIPGYHRAGFGDPRVSCRRLS